MRLLGCGALVVCVTLGATIAVLDVVARLLDREWDEPDDIDWLREYTITGGTLT